MFKALAYRASGTLAHYPYTAVIGFIVLLLMDTVRGARRLEE